jgi:uracil permease
MEQFNYIYGIDDHPPFRFTVLYALQWTIIVFPVLITAAILPAKVLNFSPAEEVRFLQLILLISGLFTAIQCLVGHKYPVVEGPSTALLLTFVALAPYGLPAIQGGTLLGGVLLMASVLIVKPKRIISIMTPNVVGVILMLISLTLLPYMSRLMTGADASGSGGSAAKFLFSIALVFVMAATAYRLRGLLKTLWLLIGMFIGTAFFFAIEHPSLVHVFSVSWFSLPDDPFPSKPEFVLSAMIAFAISFVAVVVNSIGSLQAIANLTDSERLSKAIQRGLFFNGLSGALCGLMGIVGTVSYSMSPGIVLSNRVASRFAVAWCGVLFVLAAFVPKIAAVFSLIPPPVVGAALCTAMGIQIGAALAIVTDKGIDQRSYFVVGLPVVVGTLISFLPQAIISEVPASFRVFVGNGLVFGIIFVLLLEHVLTRAGGKE